MGCPSLEVLVLTVVRRRKYKTVPAGRAGASVMARAAVAIALASGKNKIMPRSMTALGGRNRLARGCFARLDRPSGIVMLLPPEGFEKAFLNDFEILALGLTILSSLISSLGRGLLWRLRRCSADL
jgi:hypothetical protein